jgi:uncharacterized glyoxalase superfamily protein PhnB
MADTGNGQVVRVLVIGTQHEFQRHQDTSEDRKKVRNDFEVLLRRLIKEHGISLIAEEAGDDHAVWESLKNEEDALGEFVEAFGAGRTVDSPVSTIAKNLSGESSGQVRHADIRMDAHALPLVEQRDEAMVSKFLEIVGAAKSALVIVGEDHRHGVAQRLSEQGLHVQSLAFPL